MMSTYVVCANESHSGYDERREDCNECQKEPNPRITPDDEEYGPGIGGSNKKYPGRRRRYQAGDRVKIIFADGLTAEDMKTPLLGTTGVVARNETQYVEVVSDFDGCSTPYHWQHLELIEAIDGVKVGPAQRVEVGPCRECEKLKAVIRALLEVE
jgi:hypothetical protein